MLSYSIPPGVEPATTFGRPLLTTPQGGKVAVDTTLMRLWESARDRTLGQIVTDFEAKFANPDTIRCALACLAEAGLLSRSEPIEFSTPETITSQKPRVTAIIVSYNSREWLEKCLPSLLEQDYAPLKIIVVDNASQDGTYSWVQSHFPNIESTRLERTSSLAHAINQGVKLAPECEYLFLLNPDLRLERDAVEQMVAVAEKNPHCAAVAAKLRLWWAPAFLNGIGNRVDPFSWGSDNGLGHLDLGQFDDWSLLPSACFAAALIRTSAWEIVGPLDEGFPMYYEDTEWCYRARLLGYQVIAAPQAVIYHAFGGRVPSGDAQTISARKLRNVVYGRLRFALKLTGSSLLRFLLSYAFQDTLLIARSLIKLDWAMCHACLAGWVDAVKQLRMLWRERRALENRRRIPSRELFGLQAGMPPTMIWNGLPELTWDQIAHHYSPLILSGKTRPMPELAGPERPMRVLIVSNDVVDEKMAGPGLRYLEMACALRDGGLDVTLITPGETRLEIPGVTLAPYRMERLGSLQKVVEECRVALVPAHLVEKFPFLQNSAARLVIDLYDPILLENLHYFLDEPLESQQAINRQAVRNTTLALRLGDFFLCGNERQRDFWLGFLAGNERINPQTFHQDSNLRTLIDVVGIGIPDRELQPKNRIVRGVYPEIPEEARIVLWGGGIWNWLDPLTLVQAWPKVLAAHPQARLVFLGTRHPNPTVPTHEMARKAQELAAKIGERDRTIFFIEWISYQERESMLLEADVGVSLHPVHLETRYSIRARVLDYIWARLPILVTQGDVTSEWVEQYGIGIVVPPFDVQAVASALITLLDRPKAEWAPSFETLLDRYRWPRVAEPLRRYCLEGSYAADRMRRVPPGSKAYASGSQWARAKHILRTDGSKALLHRVWRYLQWRFSRP